MLVDTHRRNFIKVAGLAASSVIIGSPTAGGGLFGYSSKEVKGIPKDWFDLAGVYIYQYGNYLLDLELKHITPRMVMTPHFKTRRGTHNILPPKKLWKKIGPTLKVVDALCDQIGLPVKEIVSAYRSPDYNKAVRGKSRSYHMSNQAIDVVFHKASSWRVAKVAKQLRDRNVFKGGIGRYPGFVHIDTRGVNADW
jgi:hypothetical protein